MRNYTPGMMFIGWKWIYVPGLRKCDICDAQMYYYDDALMSPDGVECICEKCAPVPARLYNKDMF